jgi:hypothetical protein
MKNFLLSMIATLVAFSLSACNKNEGKFLLINKATAPIARATVEICGQKIELKDIQPGKSAPGSYSVKSDSHYVINVEFSSGKKLQKEDGYVTNGMDFQHEISVSDAGIEISDSKAK